MTTINVSELSTAELAALISAAMREYQRRLSEPQFMHEQTLDKPVVVVTAPSVDGQRFVVSCLKLLKTSGFVRAESRVEYKRLAAEFPQWFVVKKYPTDTNRSSTRHWLEFGGYIE